MRNIIEGLKRQTVDDRAIADDGDNIVFFTSGIAI